MDLGTALAPLAALKRFVNYETYPDPDRPGKTIKRPVDVRTGLWCNSNLPEHQYSFAEAVATGRAVGFVFNEADGYFFVDVDGALIDTPAGKAWSPLAHEILAMFPGAAVEVSQSMTGLHVIGRGKAPPHSCKNIGLHIELYTHERFVALTGTALQGDASLDHTAALTAFAERYFPPNPHGEIAGWSAEPCEGYGGPEDDADLLRAALASGQKNAANVFGEGNVTFADLWDANPDKLARKWPSDKGGYDASQADGALASHLAYWTGKNHERTRDLMFQSGLARQKWEDRPDWLETTIMRAASVVTNICKKRDPVPAPGALAGQPATVQPVTTVIAHPTPDGAAIVGGLVTASNSMVMRAAGRDFIPADGQASYFAGCVYVVRDNKVWVPATGVMLDKARMDVVYGGHLFPLDAQNDKVTDSPFDAFTRSRVLEAPRAHKPCFRPEYPSGAIVLEEGLALLNTYLPIQTLRRAGDAGPWLRHMEKLLPLARDREILYHYLASMVRNPGRKFQWCPVIQGMEGNGKSLINRLMQFCIGQRYSHLVNPDAMAKTGNQFNAWVEGKLFLGIEEIYVNNRRDFLETFKTTVTDDRIPLEGKGLNQETGDNRLNIIMFTNHADAIPVTIDSRRYCILYTAQQSILDLMRDGMTGNYFPDLYDWFYGRGAYEGLGLWYGASIVNEWLHAYALTAELDPAQQCVRAPETSSSATARSLSLGRAEQEIMEAIEAGEPGFAGGWLSSIMLDRLLDRIKAPVPRIKRRALVEALGYRLHPGLSDGRTAGTVTPDGGKPRLFVKDGHLSLQLTNPGAIGKAYTSAQHVVTNDQAASRFGGQ